MTADREYTIMHKLAMVAGGCMLIVGIWASLEIFYEETHHLINATMASVIVVSICTVVALKVSRDAWRQKNRGFAFALFCAFLFGAAFTVTTTLDRTASMRDQKLARLIRENPEIQELKDKLKEAEAKASAECENVVGRTSFGDQCKFKLSKVEEIQEKIDDTVSKIDSMGIRLAAMIPGITPDTASRYQPAIFPLSAFLFEVLLLTWGLDGRQIPPEFNMELGGRDALNAKAIRFAEQWQIQHKRLPKPADIERALNVTPQVAKRLAYIVKEN